MMRGALVIVLPLALAAAPGPVASDPVESAIGDLSPLQVSIRKVEHGLAQPGNFEQVFRYGDGFLRVQGGLYAVFDSSVYAADREHHGRLMPLVPPGTMFYIGPPPDPAFTGPPGPRPGRVETRVDRKLDSGLVNTNAPPRDRPAAQPGHSGGPGAIIADPQYRATRLRALMRQAAQQHRATEARGQAAVGRSSFSSSK